MRMPVDVGGDRLVERAAVVVARVRLGIEGVEVGRAAPQPDLDDRLGLGRRRVRPRPPSAGGEAAGQHHAHDAAAQAVAQHRPPRDARRSPRSSHVHWHVSSLQSWLRSDIGQCRYRNSAVLIRAQARSAAGLLPGRLSGCESRPMAAPPRWGSATGWSGTARPTISLGLPAGARSAAGKLRPLVDLLLDVAEFSRCSRWAAVKLLLRSDSSPVSRGGRPNSSRKELVMLPSGRLIERAGSRECT